eukprot:scaffold36298_cov122-Isochrysis_galbana.AAC.22
MGRLSDSPFPGEGGEGRVPREGQGRVPRGGQGRVPRGGEGRVPSSTATAHAHVLTLRAPPLTPGPATFPSPLFSRARRTSTG